MKTCSISIEINIRNDENKQLNIVYKKQSLRPLRFYNIETIHSTVIKVTIELKDIEALLYHELSKRKIDLKSTREEIKALEIKLEEKKVYAGKVSFYVDKFSKVISIVEMDKKSKKTFEEVHPNIAPKLDRKASTRDLP